MTKTFRTAAVMTMVAALAAGSVSAQAGGTVPAHDRQNMMNFGRKMNVKNPGMMRPDSKNVLVGQIKSIDEANGRLKVTNADGKDVDVRVSPFTEIHIFDPDFNPGEMKNMKKADKSESADNVQNEQLKKMQHKQKPAKRPEIKISNLKTGSWVMISTFETSTKTLEAAKITVRQKFEKQNVEIDAK